MIPNGKAMYYFDNKGNLWVKDKELLIVQIIKK